MMTQRLTLTHIIPASDPLLWQASALHPAEDAASCHGSSAGTDGGGAGLQLRLSSNQHQHPCGELWPHRVGLHHHM